MLTECSPETGGVGHVLFLCAPWSGWWERPWFGAPSFFCAPYLADLPFVQSRLDTAWAHEPNGNSCEEKNVAAKDEWHYAKDGQQCGPISAADLKRLASTGELAANDLVWREGMPDWKKAASIKGLFPTDQSATQTPPPVPKSSNDSPDSNGKSPKANVTEAVKSDLNDMVGAAKKAKDLTVAHARKTQISQIFLPNAYFSLGKDVLANERFREEFSDLFGKIAATNDEIAKVKTSAGERPPATDFKGKVKSGAVQLMAKGQTTKLGFQRDSFIRELGKRAYESHGDSAGPQELASPIRSAIEELSRLDAQIKSLPSSKKVPIWQRVPIAALLTVCCFPVGLALVWFNPRLSRSSKALWIGGFAAFFICMMVISGVAVQHAREELTAAHALWNSGDKPAAISKYRVLLKENLHALPESDQSLVFGRVIDFDADAGNEPSVEKLLEDAEVEHVIPSISSEKARSLQSTWVTKRRLQAESEAANSESVSRPSSPSRAESADTPAPKKASLGKPVVLDAQGVEDLIDNQEKYAGKVLVLDAEWSGRETLNQGGDGFVWPFSIGGDYIRRKGSYSHTPRRDIKIRISSSDVYAEFKSLRDLPNVGNVDKVSVKILFDGDFNNCRLLSLKRK